jgi:amino acid transporter
LIGTLAIGALYLLANAAYLHTLTLQEAAGSKLVAADVAQRALGGAGATLVSLTVVVSTLGALHGSVMTGPRVFAAMAQDAPPFGALAHLDETTGNPTRAIRLSALLGSLFVLLADFEGLADVFVLASLPFYALSVGAAFVLRRRPDWNPPYRAPGGDAMPALFAVAMVFLFVSALFDPATQAPLLGVTGVLAVGWALAPRLTAPA